MEPKDTDTSNPNQSIVLNDDDLAQQIARILKIQQVQQYQQYIPLPNIETKLDDSNYSLWSRRVKLALSGRGKWHHVTGIPELSASTHLNYPSWEEYDIQVLSWLIDSMSPDLISQFIEYQNPFELWIGTNQTYRSGEDALQIYDLHIQSTKLYQGAQPIEKYYQTCQALWREIDKRDPCDMETANDIRKYHLKTQTYRLHQFLHGADVVFDAVKRDLLKESPLSTIETAYSALRCEAARVVIVNPPANQDEIGAGLIARNHKSRQASKPANYRASNKPDTNQSAADPPLDKAKLQCDHCGKVGHLKKGCFELVGYPDWYENNPKFANKFKKGTVATASGMTRAPQSIIDNSMDDDEGELGFAALFSKQGGNRKASVVGSKTAAPDSKKLRIGDKARRGNHSRPAAAAIAKPRAKSDENTTQFGKEKFYHSTHRGNQSRSPAAATTNPPPQFAQSGGTLTPIENRDEDVIENELQAHLGGENEIKNGPHMKQSGLCVPLGQLDMMGIDPMDDDLDDLSDFLNNEEDDGLDEIGPEQEKDHSPPNAKYTTK
ncbi:hypothetical protein CASFOL_001853 [Castilleja foliolosa]|uniref:CCHC-type domain-containing protein n=1 Tax=Castilleja foliolosa TaxID=1961234 RepID=A0ABD3ECY7_9LAMI